MLTNLKHLSTNLNKGKISNAIGVKEYKDSFH